MSFTGFSFSSSGRHFVQQSGTILAISVEVIGRTLLCKYFEIRPLVKDKMSFEDFLFVALAAILFSGVEPLRPTWKILARFDPVATEQVSAQSDQKFGKRCRRLIFKMAAWRPSRIFLMAHLAILCLPSGLMLIIKFQFNWRCPKYEFSTLFPYKCIWSIQMHGEANLTLP